MKNLAVIFPGLDYSIEKPLLYYAGKIVRKFGFEVVEVSYGRLPEGDRQKVLDYALLAANVAVNRISFETYDNIFFISKGDGTAVAGSVLQNMVQKVYHILFTPVNDAVTSFSEDCLVFTSSNDEKIHMADVLKRHGEMAFELHVSKEADHNLELGDVQKDISMLRKIEEICQRYITRRISVKEAGDEAGNS
ncbi:MAG: hypothetical protein NC307_03640 [Roseburia sp.]|nr:hypothetical protein [Roseburia sp.]